MTRRLSVATKTGGRRLRQALILSAALLSGCISNDVAECEADANVEAERIVEMVTAWLEPYKSSFGIATERDGDTIYVRGRFGDLPSLFSKLDVAFLIDIEAREVACFAYLPTIVPEERRREMTEFIFRGEWEYGISTASLVLDEEGRVRCQAWSPFESFTAQPKETQWRLIGAVVDKLWSFSEGVAAVALGVDAATVASEMKRIVSFEGGDDALYLEKAADADTKIVLDRCFGNDAEVEVKDTNDEWLEKLSGHGGDASVGIIKARFEDVARDIGGKYDVLPYALIVREGMVWNVCNVPGECPATNEAKWQNS